MLTLKEAAIPQPGSNNHLEEGDEEKRSAQSIALKEKRHQKSHSCKNKSPRSCKEKQRGQRRRRRRRSRRQKNGEEKQKTVTAKDDEDGEETFGFQNVRGLPNKLDAVTDWGFANEVNTVFVSDTQASNNIIPASAWQYVKGVENSPELDSRCNRPVRGIGLISTRKWELVKSSEHNAWYKNPENEQDLFHVAYWPNDTIDNQIAQDAFKDEYYELDGPNKAVWSCGDYNCRTGAFSDETINANGRNLIDLADQMRLYRPEEIGFQNISGFTRVEHRRSALGVYSTQRSCPDGLLANARAARRLKAVNITNRDFGSDHKMVTFTIQNNVKFQRVQQPAPRESWIYDNFKNLKKVLNDRIREATENGEIGPNSGNTLQDEAVKTIRIAVQAAKDSIGTKMCKAHERNPGERVREAERRLRAAERRVSSCGSQANIARAANCKKILNEIMAKKRAKIGDGLKLDMEKQQSAKDTKQFWKVANKFRAGMKESPLPPYITDSKGINQRSPAGMYKALSEGFSAVSATKPGREDGSFMYDAEFKREIEEECNNYRLSNVGENGVLDFLWELEAYTKSMKKNKFGKSPGEKKFLPIFVNIANKDVIDPPDDQKDSTTDFAMQMMYLYNLCLSRGDYPEVFNFAMVRALYKKGKFWDPRNYRPITLASVWPKNLGSMIAERLLNWAEEMNLLSDEQFGFRKKRSTVQALLALHSIVASRKRQNKNTVAGFLDVSKAYDQVFRSGLLVKLYKKGLRGKFFSLIGKSLSNMKRRMKGGSPQEEELSNFSPEEGVAQGAPESPVLYNLFMDDLIRELKSKGFGVFYRGKKVPGLWFADDICLMADSAEELQRGFNIASSYAKRWRFCFNGSKSAVVPFGSGNFKATIHRTRFSCTNSQIPIQNEYEYLGVVVQNNFKWNNHVEKIIRIAKSASAHLAWTCRQDRSLRPRVAMYLWSAIIRPRLEYACEIWAQHTTAEQRRVIEKIQTDFIRKITNAPPGTPNVFLRTECGAETLRSRWNKLTIRFLQRTANLDEDCLAKRALDCEVENNNESASSWGSKIMCVLRSARIDGGVGMNVNNIDELQQLFQEVKFDVDQRECVRLRAEVESLSSLRSLYANLKNWEPIEKKYAFAKTHIGRPGSRFPEDYLDWMGDDPSGVRLKMLARSNQLLLNTIQASRARCGGIAARCSCCDQVVPESLEHFILHCPSYEIEREKMLRKVSEALVRVDLADSFAMSSDAEKITVLLGKQSGNQIVDRLADRAVRKFLKSCWSIRENLQSSLLASL